MRVLPRHRPKITATATPAPNANGWNRTDVQVSFVCTDTGSATASVTLNIDKTAPTVAATVTASIPGYIVTAGGSVTVTISP